MKKAFLSVGKKQPRSLRSLGFFWGNLRVLVPPLGHCVLRREFHVTSHGVDDFMRFNLMPCLLTYSRLIKSYATFTGWSCYLFTCLLTKKYGSKKSIRASRENNLTIGGGKTMGVEPIWLLILSSSSFMVGRSRVFSFVSEKRQINQFRLTQDRNELICVPLLRN